MRPCPYCGNRGCVEHTKETDRGIEGACCGCGKYYVIDPKKESDSK